MKTPQLSIIIPLYNAQDYIKRCIDSILLSKTQYTYEVILVDDGSVDDSDLIVKYYASQFHFIYTFQIDHLGVSAARNYGISKSKGEYICFVDIDDNIKSDYIDILVRSITNSNVDIVISGYELLHNGKIKQRSLDNNTFYNISECLYYLEINKRTFVQSVWNKIFKRSIVISNNISFPEDLSIGEDHLFFLRYCLYISSITTIDMILYRHIRNNNSLSNNHYEYDMLKLRASKVYDLTRLVLDRYPLIEYEDYSHLNHRTDDFYALLSLVKKYGILRSGKQKTLKVFVCNYTGTIDIYYNRRQKLPNIFRFAVKIESYTALNYVMIFINKYYDIIGKQFNC